MNISELITACKEKMPDDDFSALAAEESDRIVGTECSERDLATPILIVYCNGDGKGWLRGVAPIVEGKDWIDAFGIAGRSVAADKKELLAIFVMGVIRELDGLALGISGRTLDGRSTFTAHSIKVSGDKCRIGAGKEILLQDCDMADAVMNGYRQQWVLAEQAEKPSEN